MTYFNHGHRHSAGGSDPVGGPAGVATLHINSLTADVGYVMDSLYVSGTFNGDPATGGWSTTLSGVWRVPSPRGIRVQVGNLSSNTMQASVNVWQVIDVATGNRQKFFTGGGSLHSIAGNGAKDYLDFGTYSDYGTTLMDTTDTENPIVLSTGVYQFSVVVSANFPA